MAKRNRFFEDEPLKTKFNAKMLKKALRFALPYKKIFISIIIMMIVMSFVVLLPPMLNRYIIDYVLNKRGAFGFDYVTLAIVLMSAWVLISVLNIVYEYIRTIYMNRTGRAIIRDIRREAFAHLQTLSFDFFDSRPAGKILVRITNYLNEIAQLFSSAVTVVVVDGLKIVMLFLWLYIIEPRLALSVTCVLVPMALLLGFVRARVTYWQRSLRNKESARTAFIAENIQGQFVTKAFGRNKHTEAQYEGLYRETVHSWLRIVRYNELFFPISDGLFSIGTYLVYFVTLMLATSAAGAGALTIGVVITFITYLGMFSSPINNIAVVIQQLSAATTNLERVFELIETPPTVCDAPDAFEMPPISGDISFRDVSFGYDDDEMIFKNLNLDVPRGKMIALVGPTGAGKTTLVSLISRFYNLNSGTITIDKTDISAVTLGSLRSQIGVMMQDSFIFSGTILDNIRYARKDASLEDCVAAAKSVYAHDFIMRLPDGYNTKTLERGQGLSTGERQLLCFARVMLTDPKVLILDEATSAIDTNTEHLIKLAMDKLLFGRTSFVIAHRLSTIQRADCILYIDHGIAECGTHDELMQKKNGLYYALVSSTESSF